MADTNREINEIKARVKKVEDQLGYLFRTLGVSSREAPEGQASAAVLELLARGDRIAAIRAYREETGASLKDAKIFIESLGSGTRSW